MHELYTGRQLSSFPFLDSVIRAYGKWKEANYPRDLVRCGVDTQKMLMIWNFGMRTPVLSVLRDCVVCVFSYCLNGLRGSSTMTLEASKVHIGGNALTARLYY